MRRPHLPLRRARRDFQAAFRSEAAWNARCLERGYTGAVLPVRSFRHRLRRAISATSEGIRERLALRLAPWAIDVNQYDRIIE